MSYTDSSSNDNPSLNDELEKHLNGCDRCQESLKRRPVPNLNGKAATLCSEWFAIIKRNADWEGMVNNVVARDEFGNNANS